MIVAYIHTYVRTYVHTQDQWPWQKNVTKGEKSMDSGIHTYIHTYMQTNIHRTKRPWQKNVKKGEESMTVAYIPGVGQKSIVARYRTGPRPTFGHADRVAFSPEGRTVTPGPGEYSV